MDKEIFDSLTKGQKAAVTAIAQGFNVFVTGCGGTGKSYLTQAIIQDLLASGKKIVVCAPTGVAAENVGGVTIHRAFGMTTDLQITKGGKIKRSTPAVIRAADVILVDEISMVRMDIFDCIASSIYIAAKETGTHKQLIVCGDFFQLPPVASEKEIADLSKFYNREITMPWAFLGDWWDRCNFQTIVLDEIMRQNDTEMIENLNRCRVGDSTCISYFNKNAASKPTTTDIYLFPYKKDVDRMNTRYIQSLEGNLYEIPKIVNDKNLLESEKEENDSSPLYLKIGARVMLTKNDNEKDERTGKIKARYVNGTIGIVKAVGPLPENPDEDCVSVQLPSGEIIDVTRSKRTIYGYKLSDKGKIYKMPVGSYYEMPLVPAYALTIHKSQGKTFDYVNIDPKGCFAAGQLYVALSRAKTIRGVYLYHPIWDRNLIVDKDVKRFYATLRNDTAAFAEKRRGRKRKPKIYEEKQLKSATSAGGRPRKFGNDANRQSVPMKVPKEIADILSIIPC